MDMTKLLDKAYRETPLKELVDAPVAALLGVSENDAELLHKAFKIKTIGDFAKCKYVLSAQAICSLAEADAKA